MIFDILTQTNISNEDGIVKEIKNILNSINFQNSEYENLPFRYGVNVDIFNEHVEIKIIEYIKQAIERNIPNSTVMHLKIKWQDHIKLKVEIECKICDVFLFVQC